MSRLRFALALAALGMLSTAKPASAESCAGIVTTSYDYCAYTGHNKDGCCLYDCWSYASGTYHQHCWTATGEE